MRNHERRTPFRDVVVRFTAVGPGSASADLIQLAVQIARLLGADLRGIFVEDEHLLQVAGTPLAREIDPLWTQARPFERERLAQDFALIAAMLRRRLSAVARSHGVPVEFSVVRTASDAALAELQARHDALLIALAGEREPGPRAGGPGLLYVPPRLARQTGTIVALAPETETASARIADSIARAAHERLVVLDVAGTADSVHGALDNLRERLIVATPDRFIAVDDAAHLAALRRVPVLVVPEQ